MKVDYLYRLTLKVDFEQRKKSSPMGRFGGGWNWELGFQIGKSDIIINLLVMSIRVHWESKCVGEVKYGK